MGTAFTTCRQVLALQPALVLVVRLVPGFLQLSCTTWGACLSRWDDKFHLHQVSPQCIVLTLFSLVRPPRFPRSTSCPCPRVWSLWLPLVRKLDAAGACAFLLALC